MKRGSRTKPCETLTFKGRMEVEEPEKEAKKQWPERECKKKFQQHMVSETPWEQHMLRKI